MFGSETVLVIGAGASAEANLPVGSVLARTIAGKMALETDGLGAFEGSGDQELLWNAIASDQQHNVWFGAAQRLRNGLPLRKSIDDFLDVHQADKPMVSLGKAAIVKSILEAEKQSSLYFAPGNLNASINFGPVADTWFTKLVQLLGNRDVDGVLKNLTIVSFNYDRCIEHFLCYAIKDLYGLDRNRTQKLMAEARVFHPYGSVGKLPELGGTGPAYGQLERLNWIELGQRIHTYTEEVGAPDVEAMQGWIARAQTLVFLGFAFHRQNMALLAKPGSLDAKRVFATARGISAPDVKIVASRVKELARDKRRIDLNDPNNFNVHNEMTCSQLFDYYSITFQEL